MLAIPVYVNTKNCLGEALSQLQERVGEQSSLAVAAVALLAHLSAAMLVSGQREIGGCRRSALGVPSNHRCRVVLPPRTVVANEQLLKNRCCSVTHAVAHQREDEVVGVQRTGDMLASFDGDCHQALSSDPGGGTCHTASPFSSCNSRSSNGSGGLFASVCALRATAQAAENAQKFYPNGGYPKRRAAESGDTWMIQQQAHTPPARPLPHRATAINATNNIVSMVGSSSAPRPGFATVLASAKHASATETAGVSGLQPEEDRSAVQTSVLARPQPAAPTSPRAAAASGGVLGGVAAASRPAHDAEAGVWSDRNTRALRRALARLKTAVGSVQAVAVNET